MEFIGMTVVTDDGKKVTNIRAIRTMVPINCLMRTLSIYITKYEFVVIFLPIKEIVDRHTEH